MVELQRYAGIGPLAGILLAVAGFGMAPGPASAQDVEMLGRQYGTRPPPAYYAELASNPDAFQFSRGWARRTGLPMPSDGPGAQGPGAAGALGQVLGQRAGAVSGDFGIPLILGLFADSPDPPFARDQVQTEFFDGPNSRYRTITEYYREISGGRIELVGTTFDWRRASLTRAQTAGGRSGLSSNQARVGEYIVEVLAALDDGTVDWGQFDNDGPDGVPNSGDDDGFVDVLAVMHPTFGAECTGDQNSNFIWSHRWVISAWLGTWYVTQTPSANGGSIRINDYTIQPVQSCAAVNGGAIINEIGVFAHELGHGFGLPDLYDTNSSDGRHGAAGSWDLMATGSWGCDNASAERPCHMGAWSKAALGWVQVDTLAPGTDLGTLSLDPVETGDRIFFVESGDGSGEYFLLENRQPLGFDENLQAPGLLVWHIDPEVVANRWGSNRINVDPNHQGVWLRQADGADDLSRVGGGRGDSGDPFPGSTGNQRFHAGSNPASISHRDRAMGVTLLDITPAGETMEFRTLTRFQDVTLAVDGAPAEEGLFTVDGAAPSEAFSFRSAPFQSHELEAAAGVVIEEGLRAAFMEWADGSQRRRELVTGLGDTTLVARYGDREVLLSVELTSAAGEIRPGEVQYSVAHDQGWVPQGSQVTVSAVPRTGFDFREWTGALAGLPNPATVTLADPLTGGAAFDVVFGVREDGALQAPIRAATPVQVVLQADHANEPVDWRLVNGELPEGLVFDAAGELRGAALELGSFQVTVRATDAIGLTAEAPLSVEITDPAIGIDALTAPFLLTGVDLTFPQRQFLDRSGNRNGNYDLGDLRAHFLRNPELPIEGDASEALTRIVVPLLDLGEGSRGEKGGGR